MSLFLILFAKIIPLYGLIFLGYLARKFLQVQIESVASIVIYLLVPAVIFLGTIGIGSQTELLLIPLIFFGVSSLFCWFNLWLGGKMWQDGTERIAAFSSSAASVGFFGLPVSLALFGDTALEIDAMIILGSMIFINTVGFYTIARQHHSAQQAFFRIVKLPSIYAFLLGLLVTWSGYALPIPIKETLELLKGAYSPLGVMIAGLGLAGITFQDFDWRFNAFVLFNKFVVWLLIFLGLIYLDQHYFHLFSELVHKVLLLEAVMPVAMNAVAFSAHLKVQPGKAALAVAISTLFAFFLIPFVVYFF